MEFWLGLAVRYRLPRRKRVESPSLKLVRNLLLGRPLRRDHLLFPFSPSLDRLARFDACVDSVGTLLAGSDKAARWSLIVDR